MPTKKTPGELLFEEYLRSNGINEFDFEKLQPGSNRPPDYHFQHNGFPVLLDVKDFRGKPKDFTMGSGAYDPYRPIREKIEQGRRKFSDLKPYACGLVLYNHDKPLVDLRPMFVYGAMLGSIAVRIPLDTETGTAQGKETTVFAAGGKMLRYGRNETPIEPQNTTISAVIALGQLRVGEKRFHAWVNQEQIKSGRKLTFEESIDAATAFQGTDKDVSRAELRVIVYENPYARIAWPRDLFTGPWDERYGLLDHHIRRIYAGEAILEWERLTGREADFSK
jgi:hypothetical protein